MPRVLKHWISFFGGWQAEREARILSGLSGRAYELFSSLDYKNLPILKDWKDITDGLFEDMVEADLKGNRLGADAAIAIWQRLLLGKSLKPVFEELNDKKFSRFETSPTVNSPL